MMHLHLPVAEMSIFVPELFSVALIIGMIAGLLGISGGFILTPFMIALGIPATIAVGSGGGQVFASSYASFTAYRKSKIIDYKLTTYLTIGGIIGIASGILIFHYLSSIGHIENILRISFIILLSFVGLLMVARTPQNNAPQPAASPKETNSNSKFISLFTQSYFDKADCHTSIFMLVNTGLIIGTISGLLGIGGGFLIVPTLIYILRIPARAALAVSQTHIMCISFLGLFMHSYFNQNVDPILSLLLVFSGVTGAMIGTRFSTKLPQKATRLIFGTVIFGTVFYLIYDTFYASELDYIVTRLPL